MNTADSVQGGEIHVALDEELKRLDRVTLRILTAMSAIGIGLGLLVGLMLRTWFGFVEAGFSAVLWSWFFSYGRALDRGGIGRARRIVQTLVESLLPWVSILLVSASQGAVYALGSWVPPVTFYALMLVAVTRLKPRLCIAYGAMGAVVFPIVYFTVIHRHLPPGAPLFAQPAMQGTRSLTMLMSGVLCAVLARGLLRAIGRAESNVRAQNLFGKYRLVREIARGGMGFVFEAVYCPEGGFERRVAVKRIHPHLAATERFVASFRDEAKLSARLAHPAIVQVLDFGRIDDSYFLVMEYVEGLTLGALMQRAKTAGKRLPPDLVGHVLREILGALVYAHEGARGADGRPLRVVHRDLCPPNVLVSTNGEVKLTDFGIARSLADASESLTNHVSGHTGYMAPEQARAQAFDTRADLFPLGVIAWELFAQRRLFSAGSPEASLFALLSDKILPITIVCPDLDEGWASFIARALAREPEARFASAQEMLTALDAIPESRGIGAERLGRLVTELQRAPSTVDKDEATSVDTSSRTAAS
ncbi:MAG: serine/threonine-protein kinase [Polyangiaceae bacterium]|jgi:eukaryotic-like serine/threonine-protein kinase